MVWIGGKCKKMGENVLLFTVTLGGDTQKQEGERFSMHPPHTYIWGQYPTAAACMAIKIERVVRRGENTAKLCHVVFQVKTACKIVKPGCKPDTWEQHC